MLVEGCAGRCRVSFAGLDGLPAGRLPVAWSTPADATFAARDAPPAMAAGGASGL